MRNRLITAEGVDITIGPPSHPLRNIVLLLGSVLFAAAMFTWYVLQSGRDGREMVQLESFLSQYAQRCDTPALATAVSPLVRDTYLHSSSLRAGVDQATRLLESGATCEEVVARLRAADFPLTLSKPGQPAITLQPSN